jgi:hypothetical protein
MKRLGYPLFLVLVSLSSAILFTTITAVTLASYSKADKSGGVNKDQVVVDGSTVIR